MPIQSNPIKSHPIQSDQIKSNKERDEERAERNIKTAASTPILSPFLSFSWLFFAFLSFSWYLSLFISLSVSTPHNSPSGEMNSDNEWLNSFNFFRASPDGVLSDVANSIGSRCRHLPLPFLLLLLLLPQFARGEKEGNKRTEEKMD